MEGKISKEGKSNNIQDWVEGRSSIIRGQQQTGEFVDEHVSSMGLNRGLCLSSLFLAFIIFQRRSNTVVFCLLNTPPPPSASSFTLSKYVLLFVNSDCILLIEHTLPILKLFKIY